MHKKKVVLVWILLGVVGLSVSFGQQKYELNFREVTIDKGLSQSTVNSIVQDTLGFMWIGTADGLNRYDGFEFKTFKFNLNDSTSLSNSWISSLVIDPLGHLWIGTESGLNLYHFESQNFTRFLHNPKDLKTIADNQIYQLFVDSKQQLWVASNYSVTVLDLEGTVQRHLYHRSYPDSGKLHVSYINDFEEDAQGRIWMAGTLGGIDIYDPESDSVLHHLSHKPNDSSSLSENSINELTIAPNGDIWAGLFGRGINIIDQNTLEITSIDLEKTHLTPSGDVNSVMGFVSDQRGIYVLSYEQLFYASFDENEYHLSSIPFEKSKMTNYLTGMIDKSQNLWLGTQLSGAHIADLKPRKFELIEYEPNDLTSLAASDVWGIYVDYLDRLWVATQYGVQVAERPGSPFMKSFKNYQDDPNSLAGDYSLALAGNKESIWVASSLGGISRISLSDFTVQRYTQKDGLLSNATNTVFIDSKDRLWIGTYFGLEMKNIHSQKSTYFYHNENETSTITDNAIWSMYEDLSHRIWVISENGIQYFNEEDSTFTRMKVPGDTHGIFNVSANSIKQLQDGRYLFSTENGLLILDEEWTEYTLFDERDGLTNHFIYGTEIANDGSIWASSNNGLFQFVPDSSLEKGFLIRTFDKADGLQNVEFNYGSHFKDSKGTLYFGGISGLNFFNPNQIQYNSQVPNVSISSVSILSSSEPIHKNVTLLDEIELSYKDNFLSFSFASLDFTRPEKNEYAYRLLGFNDEWIYSKERPFIMYTNLNPGTYSLQIKASNNDGIWNEEGDSLRLIIVPPFYKTNIFYMSMIFVLIGFIFGSIRFRERSLKKINDQLEKEVKERTKKLSESEQVFKKITDNAAELISLTDRNGVILYASPSHKHLLGFDPEKIIGKLIYTPIHDDDIERIKRESEKLFAVGVMQFSEYRIRHINGTWRTFSTSGSVIRNEHDDDIRIVFVSHDISRQKKIQENLIESKNEAQKANRMKSAFLASISHELRTPLNAIIGFSEILKCDYSLHEKQRAYVSTMYKSGQHLLTMINEVLDMSKIEAGKMEVSFDSISLSSFLDDIHHLLSLKAEQKGLEFNIQKTSKYIENILTDSGKLRQILLNIIGNAIKFTHSGKVTLTVQSISFEDEEFKWEGLNQEISDRFDEHPQQLGLQFTITDTGIGIDAQQLKTIFEPFRQAIEVKNYNEGTGLGLAISSKLVELLGGSISVESSLGKGSTFTFKIPAYESTPTQLLAEDNTHYGKIEGNKSPHLLLVDDINYNLTLMKDILEPLGFICSEATNGREAIQLASTLNPDLILMDLKMPVMDGAEATKTIRSTEIGKELPIIAISASGIQHIEPQAISLFNDSLLKPIRQKDFLDTIARQLDLTYSHTSREDETVQPSVTPQKISIEQVVSDLKNHAHFIDPALIDAIELMDWNEVERLKQHLPSDSKLRQFLRSAIDQQDYLSLIHLSERLEMM